MKHKKKRNYSYLAPFIVILLVVIASIIFSIFQEYKQTHPSSQITTIARTISRTPIIIGNTPTCQPERKNISANPNEDKTASQWESDSYLIATVETYIYGTISDAYPVYEIYASKCTDHFLVFWDTPPLPKLFATIITDPYHVTFPNPTINSLAYGIDFTELSANNPLPSWKTINTIEETTHLTQPIDTNAGTYQDGVSHLLSLSGKTFYAQYRIAELMNTKQYGVVYELRFMVNSQLTALAIENTSGKILLLKTY